MTAVISLASEINNSNQDCDWLILECFIGEQSTANPTLTPWEKGCFENSAKHVLKFLDSLT